MLCTVESGAPGSSHRRWLGDRGPSTSLLARGLESSGPRDVSDRRRLRSAVASGQRPSPAALQKRLFTFVWLLFLSSPKFLRVDQDKDKDCQLACAGSSQKPLCASDGRTFLSRCEFQRAKCKDPQLEIAYRGNCRGEPCLIVRSEAGRSTAKRKAE